MSWKNIPINKIFNFEKGTLQSSKNTQGEYDFITASSEWKNHNSYSHDCEALVFAMAASGSLGRTHYVNGKFIASDLCFIITPKDEFRNKINLKFYYRYFNAIREILVKALATGSAKLSINAGNFGKYEVIIGDIEEQNKLIGKLDFIISKKTEISEYIESNIALTKKLRSSILQEAIQGKLVPQDPTDEPASILIEKIQVEKSKLIAERKIKKQKPLAPIKPEEIPYELPKGWEWVRLGETCTKITDGTHHTPHYVSNGVPFLSVKDIAHGSINFNNTKYISEIEHEEFTKRCNPEKGDVLLTKVGTTGIAKLIDTDISFSIFVSIALLKLPTEFIFGNYLESCVNSPYIKKLSADGTEGVGNKNLVLRKIERFIIPLPPFQEQKRIVEIVDELMKTCELLDEQVKQAKYRSDKLMKSILQGVFNG